MHNHGCGVFWRWVITQQLLKKSYFFFPGSHLPILPQPGVEPVLLLPIMECLLAFCAGLLQGGHSGCESLSVRPQDRYFTTLFPIRGPLQSRMPLAVVVESKNPNSLFTNVCAYGEYRFSPGDLNINKMETNSWYFEEQLLDAYKFLSKPLPSSWLIAV